MSESRAFAPPSRVVDSSKTWAASQACAGPSPPRSNGQGPRPSATTACPASVSMWNAFPKLRSIVVRIVEVPRASYPAPYQVLPPRTLAGSHRGKAACEEQGGAGGGVGASGSRRCGTGGVGPAHGCAPLPGLPMPVRRRPAPRRGDGGRAVGGAGGVVRRGVQGQGAGRLDRARRCAGSTSPRRGAQAGPAPSRPPRIGCAACTTSCARCPSTARRPAPAGDGARRRGGG